MAWSEKLKLTKQLTRSATEAGYAGPTDIQQKTLPRINGGQDIIAIGPEGSGKTTAYVLAVLNRIKYDADGVPRVLILVPDKEKVVEVTDRFNLLNKNKSILIRGLYAVHGIESQMNELADGADVVVATPDRARAIYLKLGLNLNKIDLFILDDADQIIKQGLQLPVAELANSIGKCQHLVFAEVIHEKLHRMIDPFMKLPAFVEAEELTTWMLPVIPQVLYHVPNFGTKLNLLNLFMQDEEMFTKTVVFVNTSQTAGTIFKSLANSLKDAVSLLPSADQQTVLHSFKESPKKRVLVINNEISQDLDFDGIPFLLHFELPAEKELFIERISDQTPGTETLSIIFVTDLELSSLRKIEHVIGQKLQAADLPAELLIQKDQSDTDNEKPAAKHKASEPVTGQAFHEKKASNAKTYNFSSGQKAKMNNKKKH